MKRRKKAKIQRKYPIGAEIFDDGAHFRVFASDHEKVELVIEKPNEKPLTFKMQKEKNGYFSLFVKNIKEGALYSYRLSSFASTAARSSV